MSTLTVAPIVEGHGEVPAVRILLDRIWRELLGGTYLEVLQPIRRPRGDLIQPDGLRRAVDLAALKLHAASGSAPGLILVLLDSEGEPPCQLAPQLITSLDRDRSHLDIACVLAHLEYETWFVAAAPSLERYLELAADSPPPQRPEESRSGKAWIESRFRAHKYSETVDQPRLTHAMDLTLCREGSPSFDKLCRELEARKPPAP